MAVHSLTVKEILSRIRAIFPDVPEKYVMELINDAMTDMGRYNVKYESAKTDSVSGQMWYDLSDTNSGIEVNKVFKVSFMDDDGKYRRIPRLLQNEVEIEDLT